jgi:hypothetical protein
MLAMQDAGKSWGLLGAVADIAATGIEIPQGDPDDLRKAATTWVHAGQQLSTQRRILDRAALTAAMADWTGTAAMSYMSAAQTVGHELHRGAGSCRMAGLACRQLATALDHAQDVARAAIARAQDALDRIDAAKRQVADAETAAAAADHEAGEAQAMADTARGVAGPLGEAGALKAKHREQAARSEGHAARARRGKAQALLEEAEDDLRRARHRGAEANRDARHAGRKAAMALADVASDARVSKHSFQPAVPGSPGGTPLGPLGEALKLLGIPYTDGTATIGGVPVTMPPGPVDLASTGASSALAIADRNAQAARAAAYAAFPQLSPALAGGPHGATNAERTRAVRNHEIRSERWPSTAGKWLRRGSKWLGRFAPPYQFYENHKKHMPLLENTLRTGLSTEVGGLGVTAGLACGPAAVVCSPVLGVGGSVVGDFAGGALYDGLDATYQHGIKPLAGEVGDAVEDGLGKIGIKL